MVPARYASRVANDEHDAEHNAEHNAEHDKAPDSAGDLGFPVSGEDPIPPDDRELTAMEMMGAPNRPSDSTRKTVLWISLAFASVVFVMTLGVISFYGLDILTLSTAVIVGFIIAAMIGALRYKGEDPMAQFDPPARPKRHWFRRAKD